MDLRLGSNSFSTTYSVSMSNLDSASSEQAEAPTLGAKAMQCLAKLGQYIKEHPLKVALGVALLAAGIAATGGTGLVALLGVATVKLILVVGAALIGLPVAWEFTKDKLQLNVPPTEEEIACEKAVQETILLGTVATRIAFEVYFKNQVDGGETSSIEDADFQKKIDFLKKGENLTREDLAKLDEAVTFSLGDPEPHKLDPVFTSGDSLLESDSADNI